MTIGAQLKLAGRFAHVLIVEDDDLLRRVLVRAVSSWGSEVRTACTLRQGLTAVAQPLELLIADVRLPDGTSQPLFERAARSAPTPLMIAISGKASAVEGFELRRIGANGFLPKPFTKAQLERCICATLEERELERATSSATHQNVRDPVNAELAVFARRHQLNRRQTYIVELLLSGVSRMELAAVLGVSENTCKSVVRRLLARCEVARLADIVQNIVVRARSRSRIRRRPRLK